MNVDEKIKISDEKDLYKILPKELRKEYSIGIHGFKSSDEYWDKDENGVYHLNQSEIQEAKDSILSQGLKFQQGRTLLSTVRFRDLSTYVSTRGSWEAGGIIIALPKVLRSESGKEIFVGAPNESNIGEDKQWDRNHQVTSLSEVILPEDGLLDSMFIIATYTKNEDEIEATLNPKHIAFNKGVVSDTYFKKKQDRLSRMMVKGEIDISVITETAKQKRRYCRVSLTELGRKSYQHFGTNIAKKLEALKGKSIDKNREDFNSER